ncbi:hypothetical protein OK074_2684 [Actinobacteria bacterium OK074]|nr:hypothetical protein OK074_2684 [Actinobacteria bacterium OK074]
MGFGDITSTDLNRWQLRAGRMLVELIEQSLKSGRPPLNWSVASNGSLVGRVDTLKFSNADRRAVFDEWVSVLNAERWPEHKRSGGSVHLHAVFTHASPSGEVKGAITADLDAPDARG